MTRKLSLEGHLLNVCEPRMNDLSKRVSHQSSCLSVEICAQKTLQLLINSDDDVERSSFNPYKAELIFNFLSLKQMKRTPPSLDAHLHSEQTNIHAGGGREMRG